MLRVSLVAISFLASSFGSPRHRQATAPGPLMEFTFVNDDSARIGPPSIEDCGYYLQVRGTAGKTGGTRLGAAVQLHDDSLLVTVASYRSSQFDPRDLQMVRWTLRIGALSSGTYHVNVVAGKEHVAREVRFTYGAGGCAA